MTTNNYIPLENFFAVTLAETLEDWPVSQSEIAEATGIPAPHLSGMKAGSRRCTPEYDLRLSRYFDTTPGYWLRLQLAHDLDRARREKGATIEAEVSTYEAA